MTKGIESMNANESAAIDTSYLELQAQLERQRRLQLEELKRDNLQMRFRLALGNPAKYAEFRRGRSA
jgi:ribosomal protein L29